MGACRGNFQKIPPAGLFQRGLNALEILLCSAFADL